MREVISYKGGSDSTSGVTQQFYNDVFGLVDLHIIHKIRSFPTFVFVTWEQVDNYDDETNTNSRILRLVNVGTPLPNVAVTRAHPIHSEVALGGRAEKSIPAERGHNCAASKARKKTAHNVHCALDQNRSPPHWRNLVFGVAGARCMERIVGQAAFGDGETRRPKPGARAYLHDRVELAKIVADIGSSHPDPIAMTGDDAVSSTYRTRKARRARRPSPSRDLS